MPHIQTGNTYPGILTLLWYKHSSAAALGRLADTILRGPSGLTPGERELIAAHVSRLNECEFCADSHAAAASCHLSNAELVAQVQRDLESAPISPRLKALLRVAGKVQRGGRHVQPTDIEAARSEGASDEDIHDTVLVAAAFCMFNRYVDGLGTLPAKPGDYAQMGERLAKHGYRMPPSPVRWLVRRILDRQFGA
jgi:uncharacterized peroxidase-related enzyme